jgi:uncharacterized protein (TIGR02246 family)
VTTPLSDEHAIRALVDTWMRATRDGDTATVLGLMADDVVFMVPGQEPFGRDAFAMASEAAKGVRIDGKNDIKELQISGDMAYLRSHISVTITLPNGQNKRRAGYALTLLRKLPDGRWVLSRDANLIT